MNYISRIKTIDGTVYEIKDNNITADRIPNLDASKITSGTLNASRLPSSGVTAGLYGPTEDSSPAHGSTFNVPNITVDVAGRAIAASTKTVTLPSYSAATASQDGLMSASDKSKLDNLTTGINMTEGSDGLIFTYIT